MFAFGILISSLTSPTFAAVKAGTPCTKLNQTQVSAGYSYTCIKSGKKLVWSKGVKVAAPTPMASPTPIATPVPTPSPTPTQSSMPLPSPTSTKESVQLDPVLVHLQDLISAINLADAGFTPKVNALIEEGPNGNWPNIAIDSATFALKFYAAAGLVEKQTVVNVLLGRTQPWLQARSSQYAPNCVSSTYVFTGNASLCSANWATVYSHLPDAITGDVRVTVKSDLSLVTPRIEWPYWPAMPHEIFHTYQQGRSSALGLSSDAWPAWFREGSAQAMAYSAYQKYLGGNYLAMLDISAQGGTGWGKSACTTGLPDLKPVCEYTEGFAASEYFLSRFGFGAYIDIFSKAGPSDFSGRFFMATGETLDAFYAEANSYLKSTGWASGK